MNISPRVHAFLNREQPGLLAVIGTHGPHGHPHLVPVWYRWDGQRMHIWTLATRTWVRNALRDARVGVSVQEEAEPQMAVMMRAVATVETSDDSQIDDEIRRIIRRYVPESGVPAYFREWRDLRTIVHLDPTRIFVWD